MENALFKTKYTGVKTKSQPRRNDWCEKKIVAATQAKLYSKEYKDLIAERRAANKVESAMQSKQYSNELKQYKTVNNVLGPISKQSINTWKQEIDILI